LLLFVLCLQNFLESLESFEFFFYNFKKHYEDDYSLLLDFVGLHEDDNQKSIELFLKTFNFVPGTRFLWDVLLVPLLGGTNHKSHGHNSGSLKKFLERISKSWYYIESFLEISQDSDQTSQCTNLRT